MLGMLCKSYYGEAANKSQAIKDIVDLNYADSITVAGFLAKSNYEKYIISRGYDPARKLGKEGFTSTSSQIIFSFSPIDKIVTQDETGKYKIFDMNKDTVKSISIAGDFNNWNYKNSTFQLKKNKKGAYILNVDKNKLGEEGVKVKFKFIINDTYWVVPNFAISNRVTDKGNISLFVQL